MKRATYAQLEDELKMAKDFLRDAQQRNTELIDRNKVIAAENESLRADKKWFMQMLSPLVQAFISTR